MFLCKEASTSIPNFANIFRGALCNLYHSILSHTCFFFIIHFSQKYVFSHCFLFWAFACIVPNDSLLAQLSKKANYMCWSSISAKTPKKATSSSHRKVTGSRHNTAEKIELALNNHLLTKIIKEGEVWGPIYRFNLLHLSACPKPEPGFSTSGLFLFVGY